MPGAQRRPGREPRRHAETAAGFTVAPATLNEGRGVNPGDTWFQRILDADTPALNEGRGVNPGDTATAAAQELSSSRSTKAGA